MPQKKWLNLYSFEASRERGFLPSVDPGMTLPIEYEEWELFAAFLPKLLSARVVREKIERLPPLHPHFHKNLTAREIERLMLLLSFLGHAYVWTPFEKPTNTIPASIAVPWHALATRLGRPPILSYASYALQNWERVDDQKPIELGNLIILQNFLGGLDEDWFILIHVDIEAKAGEAIAAGAEICTLLTEDNLPDILLQLETIANTLKRMNGTMAKMTVGCDPYIYYTRVRPYIHGFTHYPVVYEGVAEYGGKPQTFYGETGAQSSVVPFLDAILGIKRQRKDMLDEYLLNMRAYMPPRHRELIRRVESISSLREYVKRAPSLHGAYNECIEELTKFLRTHYEYAANYIHKQSQSSSSNPTDRGTGGTPFVAYLKKHLEDRAAYRI